MERLTNIGNSLAWILCFHISFLSISPKFRAGSGDTNMPSCSSNRDSSEWTNADFLETVLSTFTKRKVHMKGRKVSPKFLSLRKTSNIWKSILQQILSQMIRTLTITWTWAIVCLISPNRRSVNRMKDSQIWKQSTLWLPVSHKVRKIKSTSNLTLFTQRQSKDGTLWKGKLKGTKSSMENLSLWGQKSGCSHPKTTPSISSASSTQSTSSLVNSRKIRRMKGKFSLTEWP